MTDSKYQSIVMSVSSKKMNCNNIVNLLRKQNILASVTSNKSVLYDNEEFRVENGCRILFAEFIDKKVLEQRVWLPLKRQEKIDCAHVNVPDHFSGCIYDFLRKTDCPGNKSRNKF